MQRYNILYCKINKNIFFKAGKNRFQPILVSQINNLDLNNDDKTDYVKVIDNKQGESHAIILQVLANEVNLYQSHRSPAFDTKIRTFLINVFHVSTRSHYTGWDRTMYQSKSMTQFMDHFFFETV